MTIHLVATFFLYGGFKLRTWTKVTLISPNFYFPNIGVYLVTNLKHKTIIIANGRSLGSSILIASAHTQKPADISLR